MTINPGGTASSRWLIKEWCLRLSQSLEAMTGEATPVVEQSGTSAAPTVDLWWVQPFSIAPDCRVWVGATADSRQAIGRKVLAAAGIEETSPEDDLSTYREILQQALAGLAHGLSGLIGREVTAGDGQESPDAPANAVLLDAVLPGGTAVTVLFGWTQETIDRIDRKPAAVPEPKPAPRETAPAPAASVEPESAAGRTIDLLYDVELPVAVSFGRAHLPLKEVLKLTSGSIIELNRTVSEPVEIIINNCVIARGEVVVVDGNYGVRIQQIISKTERLRTLH